jgi:methionyl aminopeptidase
MFNSQEEFQGMVNAGRITGLILSELKNKILSGERNLSALNSLAGNLLLDYSAISAFKGYQPDFSDSPFEYYICASVNNEIVHGLPTDRDLKDGDIISVDLGLEYEGWYGDSAFTVGIGDISDSDKNLILAGEQCFENALKFCSEGFTLGDIGEIVFQTAKSHGVSVAMSLSGHGIGRSLHMDPYVKNYGKAGEGLSIKQGMCFAIEPILIAGDFRISESFNGLSDGWTLYTNDGTNATHHEHTVAITKEGPVVLTR